MVSRIGELFPAHSQQADTALWRIGR